MATAATPAKQPSRRTGIIVAVIVVVALLVVVGALSGGGNAAPTASPSSPAAAYSDSRAQGIMQDALQQALSSDEQAQLSAPGGQYDIAVKDKVLFVTSLLASGDTSDAQTLCGDIAALTHDPDTGAPIGLTGVVIISGQSQLASCDAPKT